MLNMFSSFESYLVVGAPVSVMGVMWVVYILTSGRITHKGNLLLMGSQFGLYFSPFSFFVFFMFWFLLVINTISLVPFGLSISALGAATLFVAVVFWLSNYLFSLKEETFEGSVGHFLPKSTPVFLMPLLVWIEIVSWLARPMALGVRLMTNITAGHLMLHFLSESLFLLSWPAKGVVFVVFIMMVFLEMVVAFVQAYVFSLLLSLYVQEAEGH